MRAILAAFVLTVAAASPASAEMVSMFGCFSSSDMSRVIEIEDKEGSGALKMLVEKFEREGRCAWTVVSREDYDAVPIENNMRLVLGYAYPHASGPLGAMHYYFTRAQRPQPLVLYFYGRIEIMR